MHTSFVSKEDRCFTIRDTHFLSTSSQALRHAVRPCPRHTARHRLCSNMRAGHVDGELSLHRFAGLDF